MKSYHATHPEDFKTYNTEKIRDHYLFRNLFEEDKITCNYVHDDRLIVGGVKPVTRTLRLEPFDVLKAKFFLERRELGVINVGDTGKITADGVSYTLEFREALYLGKDIREVVFHPSEKGTALYYFNSAPAHCAFPVRKVSLAEAETVELGTLGTSNHRTIRKLIINGTVDTCQLQMGLTELKTGSVWNTMPPHTHDRRMEVYFYFGMDEKNVVCHFLGRPQETRHIWVANHEAVLSPPWSVHCGAGTGTYSFIWGMAGENLDYADMDHVNFADLK
ncbi:MAG TPA: 5-dehydro-4-deoxy-D-glucuronate isomerase [Chryseosolibacter sp.]|nr:5-dehydro-4-deoxy-D-glucuronate isomerase [Chryseosolibacter sp.]